MHISGASGLVLGGINKEFHGGHYTVRIRFDFQGDLEHGVDDSKNYLPEPNVVDKFSVSVE